MKKWMKFLAVVIIWQGGATALGQEVPSGQEAAILEEVVVTGTRTPVPGKESSLSYTVITDKEIQERQVFRAEEVLRGVPGAIMSQSGSRGGATSSFLRGGNANMTQVLFNGIRLNDAGGDFDWNALTVDNVERIEVIRGPMSALYGADAMTGVVNLVTKKGTGPPSLTLTGSWGPHSENGNFTGENRVSLLGSYKNFGYSLAYSRIDDMGILNINNRYANNVLTARLDYEPLENLSFTFVNLLVDSRFGFPSVNGGDRLDPKSVGGPGLDPDRNTTKLDLVLGLTGRYWPFNWWENELTLAYSYRDRHYNDPGNPQATDIDLWLGAFFSRNLERRLSLDYHSNFRVGSRDPVESITTLGVAARREQLNQSSFSGQSLISPVSFTSYLTNFRTSTAFYAQEQLAFWQRLFLTGGFRVEDNSVFSQVEFIPRGSAAFRITETDTTIRAAGGKAIKEPTFLESFFRDQLSVANPKLRPEQNVAWEVGADQYFWKDRLKFGLTYFENHFTDLITYVRDTFSYENIGAVRTTGLEFALRAVPVKGLTLTGAYTNLFQFTVLDDGGVGGLYFKNGKHLLRRPRNSFSFNIDWSQPRYGLNVNLLYVGRRDDTAFYRYDPPLGFPSARVENGDYFLVNLAGYYTLAENWKFVKKAQLTLRLNNLLDRNYMEVYGYSSPRFSVLGGLRLVI